MILEFILFFIFVFSFLYLLKNILGFVFKLLEKEPTPMKLTNKEMLSLFLSISYIITYLKIL